MTRWQLAITGFLLCVTFSSSTTKIAKRTDPRCLAARCSDKEVCVLKNGEPECVTKLRLIKLAKKHGLQHPFSHHAKPHKHINHEEHAKHDRLHRHKCSHNELMSMGGRLLQWFSDIHRIHSGRDKTLPAHKITCRNDVAWMFMQWDGNEDGFLSRDELRPLEGNGREVCLAQFIDMCDDIVVDGKISVDEWCDCFSFADDVRHEPPCHKQKHAADPHMNGVFLPRCDLEGYYRPEQCHRGYCWCVDRYGREFDKSRIRNELPNCEQYASQRSAEDEADLLHRI